MRDRPSTFTSSDFDDVSSQNALRRARPSSRSCSIRLEPSPFSRDIVDPRFADSVLRSPQIQVPSQKRSVHSAAQIPRRPALRPELRCFDGETLGRRMVMRILRVAVCHFQLARVCPRESRSIWRRDGVSPSRASSRAQRSLANACSAAVSRTTRDDRSGLPGVPRETHDRARVTGGNLPTCGARARALV